jgi:hypothetical protein
MAPPECTQPTLPAVYTCQRNENVPPDVWGIPYYAAVESNNMQWSQFSPQETAAATALGWDQASWDCDYSRSHAAGGVEECYHPASEDKYWVELTVQEQQAAAVLGWNQESWDNGGGGGEPLGLAAGRCVAGHGREPVAALELPHGYYNDGPNQFIANSYGLFMNGVYQGGLRQRTVDGVVHSFYDSASECTAACAAVMGVDYNDQLGRSAFQAEMLCSSTFIPDNDGASPAGGCTSSRVRVFVPDTAEDGQALHTLSSYAWTIHCNNELPCEDLHNQTRRDAIFDHFIRAIVEGGVSGEADIYNHIIPGEESQWYPSHSGPAYSVFLTDDHTAVLPAILQWSEGGGEEEEEERAIQIDGRTLGQTGQWCGAHSDCASGSCSDPCLSQPGPAHSWQDLESTGGRQPCRTETAQLFDEYGHSGTCLPATGESSSELPPPELPLSCREILEQDASASSGLHEILLPDGSHAEVYCDMDTDGGGWTLTFAVRNVIGAAGPDNSFFTLLRDQDAESGGGAYPLDPLTQPEPEIGWVYGVTAQERQQFWESSGATDYRVTSVDRNTREYLVDVKAHAEDMGGMASGNSVMCAAAGDVDGACGRGFHNGYITQATALMPFGPPTPGGPMEAPIEADAYYHYEQGAEVNFFQIGDMVRVNVSLSAAAAPSLSLPPLALPPLPPS